MIYHTLSSGGYLYRINRNRAELQNKLDKRRTFLLVCLITTCVTIATIIFLLSGCTPQHDQNGNAVVPRISTPAERDVLILEELQKQTAILKEIRDKWK